MSESDDEARLRAYATQLSDAVEGAIGPWVQQAVERRLGDAETDAGLEQAIIDAAQRATSEVAPRVRALLAADIDEQRTTPLELLRGLVPYAANVLQRHDIPPVERDAHAVSLHPDDFYDLTPGRFADFGDTVGQAGIVWGAAKAHVHLRRRARDGQR